MDDTENLLAASMFMLRIYVGMAIVFIMVMFVAVVVVVVMMMAVMMVVMVVVVMMMVVLMVVVMHRIVQPKFWHSISYYSTKSTNAGQCIAQIVLDISRESQEKGFRCANNERNSRCEDQDCNETRRDRIPSRPAKEVHENCGRNNRHRAKGVGQNMEEYSVHVFICMAVVVIPV